MEKTCSEPHRLTPPPVFDSLQLDTFGRFSCIGSPASAEGVTPSATFSMEQLASLFELSVGFHACNSIDSFAKTLATHVGRNLEARAVMVWLRQERSGELLCRSRWFEAGLRLEITPGQASDGILAEVLAKPRARRLDAEEIEPEMFLHLAEQDRERVATALYAPIPTSEGVAGVLEVLNKRTGKFTADDAGFVEEACRLAGRVLDALRAVEQEKWSNLQTIGSRLRQTKLGSFFGSFWVRFPNAPCVFNNILASFVLFFVSSRDAPGFRNRIASVPLRISRRNPPARTRAWESSLFGFKLCIWRSNLGSF